MTTSTFDQSPPRRPGIDDVGGGQKQNDPNLPPPDPELDPCADDFNQLSQQAVAAGKVLAVARLSIDQSGGDYTLVGISCASSTPTTTDFEVTKNGVGDVTITWPDGTFPTAIARPRAHIIGSTPLAHATQPLAHGARVRMIDMAGTPAESGFDLDIF
jgi:hypothetical protein